VFLIFGKRKGVRGGIRNRSLTRVHGGGRVLEGRNLGLRPLIGFSIKRGVVDHNGGL